MIKRKGQKLFLGFIIINAQVKQFSKSALYISLLTILSSYMNPIYIYYMNV